MVGMRKTEKYINDQRSNPMNARMAPVVTAILKAEACMKEGAALEPWLALCEAEVEGADVWDADEGA